MIITESGVTQNHIEFVKVKIRPVIKSLVKKSVIIEEENHENGSEICVLQIRHLEMKREKVVQREELVRFLLDAMAVQFRNPSVWS